MLAVAVAKSNVTPNKDELTISCRFVNDDGPGAIEWGEAIDASADDLSAAYSNAHREAQPKRQSKRATVEAEFRRLLAEGPRPVSEIKPLIAKATGAGERTIDNVANELGVPAKQGQVCGPWHYPSLAGDYGFETATLEEPASS